MIHVRSLVSQGVNFDSVLHSGVFITMGDHEHPGCVCGLLLFLLIWKVLSYLPVTCYIPQITDIRQSLN